MNIFPTILTVSLLFFSPGLLPAQEKPASYGDSVLSWQQQREQALKAEDGWLNLVGLFWLKEGRNNFGSDVRNDLVFPEGSISPEAGYLERSGFTVKLVANAGSGIRVDGKEVPEAIVYSPVHRNPPVISCNQLRWTIIRREDKIGVRLRDLANPALKAFRGIERFETDPAWKVTAKLVNSGASATVSITNVLGQTSDQKSPGKLHFMLQGRNYSLDALEEGDKLFILFGDATNGESTYPSGRFLYVDRPGEDGQTTIDFNKAFNPPCAFTPYATCPIPPRQNQLPISVRAGEKNYHQ